MEGGGGTTAVPGPETAPGRPECSTEGGGGTTFPFAAVIVDPIPSPDRTPWPANCGGGATTREFPPPRVPGPRLDPCTVGGGATTAPPGPLRGRPPFRPATSAGGATTALCGSPLKRPACPPTLGGGATTPAIPPGACRVGEVAESGTAGMAGFDARFGAFAPSAAFRSGGTSNFGALRCSAATGIGLGE